ncbi:MAG: hypothetical protein AB7O96_02130 [Pseudobdellovibrionaceae bacterium]
MFTKTLFIVLTFAFALPTFANSSNLESGKAQQLMASLKQDLAQDDLTHSASFSINDSIRKTSLEKINTMKKRFDQLSKTPGIGILERSTLNDLSMMLGNISEKNRFDQKGCQALRSELKAAFNPLEEENNSKPELNESLEIVSILCKDAPTGI